MVKGVAGLGLREVNDRDDGLVRRLDSDAVDLEVIWDTAFISDHKTITKKNYFEKEFTFL